MKYITFALTCLSILSVHAMQKNNTLKNSIVKCDSIPDNGEQMGIQAALVDAVLNEDKEKIQQYINLGAAFNKMDSRGRYALIEAAKNDRHVILPSLLDNKTLDPNIQDRNGRTALHEAAANIHSIL